MYDDGEADYRKYSLRELEQTMSEIDSARFPKNHAKLVAAIDAARSRTAEDTVAVHENAVTGEHADSIPGSGVMQMDWSRAVKIWWFIAWRSVLASVLVSVVAGFFLGFLVLPFVSSESTEILINTVVSLIIGTVLGVWVVSTLPEKRFRDFRVVLLSEEPERTDSKQ